MSQPILIQQENPPISSGMLPIEQALDENPGREIKLCDVFLSGKECIFGDRCKYSHNTSSYLDSKPPDISNICSFFDKYGNCPYGIRCRFLSGHKTIDNEASLFQNVCTEDRQIGVRNIMPAGIFESLRKRDYVFPNSAAYFKQSLAQRVSTGKQELSQLDIPIFDASRKASYLFNDKLYLAPLTTVGNLPFRRICKTMGADVTCSEMALASNLLKGVPSEWALLKRHASEDIFGVQLCGGHPELIAKAAELVNREASIDFIDINMGCPIDLVFEKGMGSALLGKPGRMEEIVKAAIAVSDVPITIKLRTGILNDKNLVHKLMPKICSWGVAAVTLHGRTRAQRYTKDADWNYIQECRALSVSSSHAFIGNGDVMSQAEYYRRKSESNVDAILIARGALVKPWIFTEIKERRDWDISASERLGLIRDYVHYGLEYFGSDSDGVTRVRKFLLEWMSFLHRYVPIGLTGMVPQKINERPPILCYRSDLEALLASNNVNDWIKISEMFLGKTPTNFTFTPKHKSNSYQG